MIKEFEVALLLSTELPGIRRELSSLPSVNVYKAAECFASYTLQLLKEGNLHAVKNCFNLAENFLQEGSSTVKNAVCNVYLFSIGCVIDLSSASG